MIELAPIVLFAHSRLGHLRQTVDALLANPEARGSDLVVFSDGPRLTSELEQVVEVRDYLSTIRGFKSVEIYERKENLGLSKSIIDGVTKVFETYEKAIVLEDDIVTSQSFLRFMNDGLSKFADDERVASIHGYLYPIETPLPEAFFLLGADCWGWGTWRRAWSGFEDDAKVLADGLKHQNLRRIFDFNGSYPFSQMLDAHLRGEVDSWAIRWSASMLLQGKLTLYPGKSLVRNIGNDGNGTHSGRVKNFDGTVSHDWISLESVAVEDSVRAREAFEVFFRSLRWPRRLEQLLSRSGGEKWTNCLLKKRSNE